MSAGHSGRRAGRCIPAISTATGGRICSSTNPGTGIWVEAFSDGAWAFNYAWGQWDRGWTVGVPDFNLDGRADTLVSNASGVFVQNTNTGDGIFSEVAGNWGTGWRMYYAEAVRSVIVTTRFI